MISFSRKKKLCKNCIILAELAEFQRREILLLKEIIESKQLTIDEKDKIINILAKTNMLQSKR